MRTGITNPAGLLLAIAFAVVCMGQSPRAIGVYVIGDSTIAAYSEAQFPQCGWGACLQSALGDGYRVENFARGGRSSKSFYDEGSWTPVMKALQPGDYVLIQFGHNDWWQKTKPDIYAPAETVYKAYLTRYITEVREKEAIPVLVTPIARYRFNSQNQVDCPNPEYPQAMKALGKELQVPVIDLDTMSRTLLQSLGKEEGKKFYCFFGPGEFAGFPDGKSDGTHTRREGANAYASIVANELKVIVENPGGSGRD